MNLARPQPEAIVDGVIMDSAVVVESIRNLVANLKITNKNVATSVATMRSNSAGDVGAGSSPIGSQRARTSPSFKMRAISALSLFTSARGVLAGASKPNHRIES